MDVSSQRDVLLDAIQQQYKDSVTATEVNRRLADEQISYANEKRGTYYSGLPTWERAQNATAYAEKMNGLNKNLLTAQESVWRNIQDVMDKVNAYNEAAKKNNSGTTGTTGRGYSTNLGDYYSSEKGYQFVDKDGNPITAAAWAKLCGYDTWAVVDQMAANGDKGAQAANRTRNKPQDQWTDEEKAARARLGV